MSKHPRHVRPVSVDDLSTWTTRRLLAYRDRLLQVEESIEASDADDQTLLDPDLLCFKSDPRWELLYAAIKVNFRGEATEPVR